jgi:hypothetical protein
MGGEQAVVELPASHGKTTNDAWLMAISTLISVTSSGLFASQAMAALQTTSAIFFYCCRC